MARRYYRKNKNADFSQLFIIILVLFAVGSYLATSFNKQLDFISLVGPILVIIVILFGVILLWILVKREQRRMRALEIADIDNMAGEQFEYYVGEVMKSRGYHVTYTKRSGDFGTDIVAVKDNRRYSVQLKRYNHPVGPPAVHQAVGSMVMYNRHILWS